MELTRYIYIFRVHLIIMCQTTTPGLKLENSLCYEYQSNAIHAGALPRPLRPETDNKKLISEIGFAGNREV